MEGFAGEGTKEIATVIDKRAAKVERFKANSWELKLKISNQS
jgi:hypothetical protein